MPESWFHHFRKIAFVLCLGLILNGSLKSQIRTPGVELGLKYSYSGLNLAANFSYQIDQVQLYAGPILSLTRGSLSTSQPLGFDLGGSWLLNIPDTKWGFMVNLDYQSLFFPGELKTDRIDEVHLNYGLRYSPMPNFFLIHQMGYGVYFDRGYSPLTQSFSKTSGYNGMFNLKLAYEFPTK